MCAHDILGGPGPGRLQWTHRHLVHAQSVGAVGGADLVGRNGVLQAFADLAELLEHLDLAVGTGEVEPPAALDDIGGRYVGAAGVGVCECLDVSLIHQAAVRLA